MRKILWFAVIFACVLGFGPKPAFADASAVEAWCNEHGESWDADTLTCTVKGWIDHYGLLDNLGAFPGRIDNYGTINNYGTIWNEGSIRNYGTFKNFNRIESYGGISNYGTFFNHSAIISSPGGLGNAGIFYNYSAIHNNMGGFGNSGKFYNYGSIWNMMAIVNNQGTVYSQGTFVNYIITLTNNGAILNSGTFDNIYYNKFINSGTIVNCGIFKGPPPDVVGNPIDESPCGDMNPPETSITAQPNNPTYDTSASFGFTGTDDVTATENLAFECQLDGGGFSPCTSPQEYFNLSDGSHTFEVQAIDEALHTDPTPESWTWEVIVSVEGLTAMVEDLNLQEGVENSLDAKLDAALKALEDLNENNDVAAVNALQAFINAVEAQRGKNISEADADQLILYAEALIDKISAG